MKQGLFIFLASSLFLISCKPEKKTDNLNVLTKRIQYEVSIKSPDLSFDWWIQNIEGQKREGFVKGLVKAAYDGNIDVYDNFGKELSNEQVKKIENNIDSVFMTSQLPPFNDSLVITKNELNLKAITRLSFMEEWKFDPDSYEISKRTIGYAPLVEKYDKEGNFRGYKPLFWIYFDKSYPAELLGINND